MRALGMFLVMGLGCLLARAEAQEASPAAESKPDAAANPPTHAKPVPRQDPAANADRPQLPLTDCEVGREGFIAHGFKIHSTAEDRYVAVHSKLEGGKLVPVDICIIY